MNTQGPLQAPLPRPPDRPVPILLSTDPATVHAVKNAESNVNGAQQINTAAQEKLVPLATTHRSEKYDKTRKWSDLSSSLKRDIRRFGNFFKLNFFRLLGLVKQSDLINSDQYFKMTQVSRDEVNALAPLKREDVEKKPDKIIPLKGFVPSTIANRTKGGENSQFDEIDGIQTPHQFARDVVGGLVLLNGQKYTSVKKLREAMNLAGLDQDTQRRLEHLCTQDLPNTIMGLLQRDLPGLTVNMVRDPPPTVDIDTHSLPPKITAKVQFEPMYGILAPDGEDGTEPFGKIKGKLIITDLNNADPVKKDAIVIISKLKIPGRKP